MLMRLFWKGLIGGGALGLALAVAAGEQQASRLNIEDLRLLVEVIQAVKENYVEPVDNRMLLEGATRGLLNGLDPDSNYLDKNAFAELQTEKPGVAGIGLEMGITDGLIRVVTALEDTPASRGGVRNGDLIFKIDELEVKGMSLTQVVERLRGKPDTNVTLSIFRQGQKAPFSITLKREVIRIQSVKSKWLEPGYAYVRLTQFQQNTTSELVRHLQELSQQDTVRGLLLDLRNNPGGLFLGAVSVTSAFLPQKMLIVSTDGRLDDAKREYRATQADYLSRGNSVDYLEKLPAEMKTIPLVVLVNGKSAAASEIVSGALQDHKRAVIVGTPTFGRASIQTILPIPNGTAIKLTTSRWYTPNGRSVLNKGIAPDIKIDEKATEYKQGVLNDDYQLRRSLGILKKLYKDVSPLVRATLDTVVTPFAS